MPLVYWGHIAFYALFLLRRLGGSRADAAPSPAASPLPPPAADPHAVRLLVFHCFGFFVFYFGLGRTLFARRGAPILWAPHPAIGALVIASGAVLLASALLVFRSWRLLARIEAGHQLCTTGPFRIVRHPIYLSLDLLAVGTVIWVPGLLVLAGAALVVLGGDLRARAEERLLAIVFGDEYRAYQRRVPRTVPGLY
jgi:protein-S-isoprenylcysteine O-methyltransferase Ste14